MSHIKIELALRIPHGDGRPGWRRWCDIFVKSEESPRDLEELAFVLDSLPCLVASFDGDGRLLYLNAVGRLWLGIGESGVGEAILSDLLSEPGAERLLRDALPQAARTGHWDGNGELLPRKGNPIPVVLQLVSHPPLETRRVAFTLAARPSRNEAEGHEPFIAASLGFLHDLNNLLGPIIAYASLSRDRVDRESPVFRYQEQILTAADRAQKLSQAVSRRIRPPSKASRLVVLSDVVEEVVDWLRAEHAEHEFEMETPLSKNAILGDAAGLQQMVLNLCKNAVESLPPHGGKVSIAVRDVEGRGELRFTVRDNGCGMGEAILGRIFEPFFSTKAGGTGVGLSITREVVRRHRGTMSIESTPGSGTSFHVQLPIDDSTRS
jgi:signal transduction histidine kinase